MPNRAVETRGSHLDAHATGENSRLMELVANFRFQEQAKENIGQYVDELALAMSLPSIDELPTSQKTAAEFAAMVEVDDPTFEKKLKVIRNGAETVVSTLMVDASRDEIDFRNPKTGLSEKSFQTVLAILAEGAARFKAVAESDQLAGPKWTLTRTRAEHRSKQLLKEASKLAFLSPRGLSTTHKIRRAFQSGAIMLALSACGIMAAPPVVEANDVQSITPAAEVIPPIDAEIDPNEGTQEQPPIPKPTTPPESITALVGQFGFTLEEVGDGWAATQEAPGGDFTLVLEVINNAAGEQVVVIESEGQRKEYKSEDFDSISTIALGLDEILVTYGADGEVETFFLPSTGEWVEPIEIQTNPEDPNTYPEIALEDVWSGKLMISVALNAEAFSEEALIPTGFVFERRRNFESGAVVLVPWIDGSSDQSTDHGYQAGVNEANDYRRYVSVARSSFISEIYGQVEVIIATEQIKAPDGKTLLVNYIMGPEWYLTGEDDERLPNGEFHNLVDSVLKGQDSENETDAERFFLEPVLSAGGGFRSYSHRVDPETGQEVYTVGLEYYQEHGPDGEANPNLILPPEIAEMLIELRRDKDGDFIWVQDLNTLAEYLGKSFVVGNSRDFTKYYFGSGEDQSN